MNNQKQLEQRFNNIADHYWLSTAYAECAKETQTKLLVVSKDFMPAGTSFYAYGDNLAEEMRIDLLEKNDTEQYDIYPEDYDDEEAYWQAREKARDYYYCGGTCFNFITEKIEDLIDVLGELDDIYFAYPSQEEQQKEIKDFINDLMVYDLGDE